MNTCTQGKHAFNTTSVNFAKHKDSHLIATSHRKRKAMQVFEKSQSVELRNKPKESDGPSVDFQSPKEGEWQVLYRYQSVEHWGNQ